MQKKFSLIVIGIMMLIFSGCSDAKKISQATNKEQVEENEKPTPDGQGIKNRFAQMEANALKEAFRGIETSPLNKYHEEATFGHNF